MIKIQKIDTITVTKEEYLPAHIIPLLKMVRIQFTDVTTFDLNLELNEENKTIDVTVTTKESKTKVSEVTGINNMTKEELNDFFNSTIETFEEKKSDIVEAYKELLVHSLSKQALIEVKQSLGI